MGATSINLKLDAIDIIDVHTYSNSLVEGSLYVITVAYAGPLIEGDLQFVAGRDAAPDPNKMLNVCVCVCVCTCKG